MKRGLRKEMVKVLHAMPDDVRAAKSRAAADALLALPAFQKARTIMVYLSMPGEMDTSPIALDAWQANKIVLAPKVGWEQRHMSALEINSLDSGLVTDHMGLRQPAVGEPWPLHDIDLVIVPALAFDRRGHRLGRGMGFYDRFLAHLQLRAVKCGLGFSDQVVDELPVAPNDEPIDMLVTDTEVLRF